MVYTIRSLVGDSEVTAGVSYGPSQWWVRSIPVPFYGGHMRGAWAVLTGKAVAVRYPIAGELEAALAETGGINVPNMKRNQ